MEKVTSRSSHSPTATELCAKDSDEIPEHDFRACSVQCPPGITEQRLVAKIDWKLLPILCVIYLMAFLDRVNIANAAVFGLKKDLKLLGNEYNVALTVFFVPYVVFEIPSNMLLKQLRPHVWLSGCMFLFGLVMLLQGFVQNYRGLIATRFFLGLSEAGIFPGCFYLIGMWYKRTEAQRRYTLFFGSTLLAGAFGGLLASAIGKMDGIRGYSAWRWVFILEGTLTCVIALATFFIISDFPEDAKWLREDERAYVKARLMQDQGKSGAEHRITLYDILDVFKDYKVFLGGIMYFSFIIPAYGFSYFSPTIIQTYGYSPIETQLHSVAPYAAAFVFSLLIAYLSDKARHRFLFVILGICIAIVGVGVLLNVHHKRSVEYAALFLVAMGTYSAMPIVICWFAMNLRGHRRRSIGTAWQIGFGNIAGIVATFAFLSTDAPYYHIGYSLLMGFFCLAVLSSTAYLVALWSQNPSRRNKCTNVTGTIDDEVTGNEDLDGGFHYMY